MLKEPKGGLILDNESAEENKLIWIANINKKESHFIPNPKEKVKFFDSFPVWYLKIVSSLCFWYIFIYLNSRWNKDSAFARIFLTIQLLSASTICNLQIISWLICSKRPSGTLSPSEPPSRNYPSQNSKDKFIWSMKTPFSNKLKYRLQSKNSSKKLHVFIRNT